MRARTWVGLAIVTAAAGCRSTPPAPPSPFAPVPAEVSSAAPPVEGESLEAAVLVAADNEEDGIAWENDWIWRHYGRFRRRSGGLASLDGRRYDVITVELSDHSTRIIYFDITDFFGREKSRR